VIARIIDCHCGFALEARTLVGDTQSNVGSLRHPFLAYLDAVDAQHIVMDVLLNGPFAPKFMAMSPVPDGVILNSLVQIATSAPRTSHQPCKAGHCMGHCNNLSNQHKSNIHEPNRQDTRRGPEAEKCRM
jgi:hypothetical protein